MTTSLAPACRGVGLRNDGGRPLGVALVGHGFMGAVHSQAWRLVGPAFGDPSVTLVGVAGRDVDRAARAADRYGWGPATSATADWRALVTRDDVDIVDVVTPGAQHADVAIAALEARKHVLCEKPLANTLAEAEHMAAAAAKAAIDGVQSMVGFNYRRVPAMAYAAALIRQGRVGDIRHVRVRYLQDWLVDPSAPRTWRLQASEAGTGALGDLGSHAIDLVQHLTGDAITRVSGSTTTFVTERPLPDGQGVGPVTVDDCALAIGRTGGGATVSIEVSRVASGCKNGLSVEIDGSAGGLRFHLESLNELLVLDGAGADAGYRRVLVTEPTHPYLSAWWPPGHVLGWDHTFVHQAHDLVQAIVTGQPAEPTFADGLRVQRVLDAVQRSAAAGGQPTEVLAA